MVLGSHSIFCAYGFWLPNDPRGSWSDFVRAWELVRFGKATKVDTRRSVARAAHDVSLRLRAKEALKYPPVVFTGRQAKAVGDGFAQAVAEGGYVVRACTILPEHLHILLAPHERGYRRIVGHLKARATQRLLAEGLHPLARFASGAVGPPSPWARLAWHVYLKDEAAFRAAIRYVQDNPLKEGKPRQHWSFVT
jgi:REP element-mobilizing transposase RayT